MSHCGLLVGGDINLPAIKCWDSGFVLPGQHDTTIGRDFVTVIQDNMLVQKVVGPTRGENTLDIVLSSIPDCLSVEVRAGVSDHDMIFGKQLMRLDRTSSTDLGRKIIRWSAANWMEIGEQVADKLQDYELYVQQNNIDVSWEFLHSVLLEATNLVPVKMARHRKDAPFITRRIKRCLRKRNRKYAKARESGSATDWDDYTRFSKEVKGEIRLAKNRFFNNLLEKNMRVDSRRFYKLVNTKRVDKTGIPSLSVGSRLYHDPLEKAELLNSTFSEVYQRESASSDMPQMGLSPYSEMPDYEILPDGVLTLLKKQRENKAAGSDGISPVLLRNLAEVLARPLACLYNKCYDLGMCPRMWCSAFVCPIYKSRGSRSDPNMYRPISLTPICCKIYEHILVSNMMKFFDEKKIIKDEQFGFRRGRSCELQLLMFTDDVLNSYENDRQLDAVFLDMSRAFDKVPHLRLLEKIQFYGIRGSIVVG